MGSVWLSIFLVIRDLPTPRSRHPAPDPWRMAEDGCPSPPDRRLVRRFHPLGVHAFLLAVLIVEIDIAVKVWSETSSYTAATAPVINTSNDDVLTGDFLRVDIDGAGTGAKGLIVMVTLQPV